MVNFLFTHSQISPNYTLPFYSLILLYVIGKSPRKSNATSMQASCTCIHFIIFGSLVFAYFQPFMGVLAFYQVLKYACGVVLIFLEPSTSIFNNGNLSTSWNNCASTTIIATITIWMKYSNIHQAKSNIHPITNHSFILQN